MQDQNPYQSPHEAGKPKQGGIAHRWGAWGVVLWIFGIMAAIALYDLLAMYIGIWMGTR
jgi:hypothetical protein